MIYIFLYPLISVEKLRAKKTEIIGNPLLLSYVWRVYNMRSASAYFYSIFATTLVLVILGIVCVTAYEAKEVSVNLKENLVVEVVLGDDVTQDSISTLKGILIQKVFVKKVTYVSKDEAAESLKKELGSNYLDILGYNPLYPSYRVNLKEPYANQESIERVQRELAALPGVREVNIQKSVLTELDKTLRSFSYIGLIIGALFLAFAVSLIFTAIKLDIFSRSQVIRSMQLFGATRWFIIKPYLGRSLFNGLISGVLATVTIYGVSYYMDYEFPMLGLTADLIIFALLLGVLMLLGIFISFFSTLIALTRYLNYKLYDLY
jgi:cell division transport system permease protein